MRTAFVHLQRAQSYLSFWVLVPIPPALSKLLLERRNEEFSSNSFSLRGRRRCRGCQAAI